MNTERRAGPWGWARLRHTLSSKANVACIVIGLGLIALIGFDVERDLSVLLLRVVAISSMLIQLRQLRDSSPDPANSGSRLARRHAVLKFIALVILLVALLAAIGYFFG